jgi:CBS domain-containing protein
MNLLKIARVPAPTVSPDSTVLEAVEKMVEVGVGAAVVVDQDNEIEGIITERDILQRVAKNCMPCDTTKVSEVMSTTVQVATADTNPSEALSMMDSGHFRHLPIVDDENRVQGILSIRHLLHHIVEDLSQELQALDSYVSADGIGG